MLLFYISLVVVCGIVSSAPQGNYTDVDRTKITATYMTAGLRLPFTCPDAGPSPSPPTSVHALRPADIKYVGAIGDSLTAASGGNAATLIGLLIQYRGVSWCMGGDSTLDSVVTLPNILRNYNPTLYGQSSGTGNADSNNAVFNAAVPGAVSADMVAQANKLVDKMISRLGQAEFDSSWKLITFFIGGNDLCDYCNDQVTHSPEQYRDNVKAALDVFYNRMPYTLVNFVTVLNVAELEDLHDGIVCQGMQLFLCDCAINTDTREQVRAANLEYQKLTNELIDSRIYDQRDDFTVVRQPFMEHMKVPSTSDGAPDFSYFAPDCFHFSKKGHGAAAIELWNNMMQPVGSKTTVWNLEDTLICPSEKDGFIYTWKNSA